MLSIFSNVLANPDIVGLTTVATMIGCTFFSIFHSKDSDNEICKYKELNKLSGDGVNCSKNVRLSIKQSNEHVIMIAPSGSGKSRRFIAHNIKNLQNCSLIVTDPSGELERMCDSKKKKYILNPFNNKTIGYDPLRNCRNEFEVRKMARVILLNGMTSFASKESSSNQQDWVSMATPLLTAYMLFNYETKKYTFDELISNICTLPVISEVKRDKDGKVVSATNSIELEIFMSEVESAILEFKSFKQVIEAKQTLSSIRTVMNSCLQLFFDKNVKKLFHRENLDLSKLRTEESVVYIQIPEHHSEYFSPLVATFLTQVFDYLLDNDGLQVYCLFDEFTNNGIIPGICRLLSTARKHNVSIVAAIQSLVQLTDLYGEIKSKQLSELFKTMLVCGGLKDSAEYISKLIGNEEYTENKVTHSKPLMTASQVRLLDEDDMLIICNNKRPVLDKMMDKITT